MKRIGLLGDIGSGKSFIAKNFGYPVFNADNEVDKLYKKNRKIFKKLNRISPQYIRSFPIRKKEIIKAILEKKKHLKKIVKIVHFEIKKEMNFFLKKNKRKKIIILDIPLLMENNINKKNDILVFVDSRKKDISKRLLKRKNFNKELLKRFRKIQLPLDYKKRKSHFIIKNDFSKRTIKKYVKDILSKV